MPPYTPRLTIGYDKAKAATGRSPYWFAIDRKKRYFETEAERDKAYQTQLALQQFGVGHIEATARHDLELREMIRLAEGRPSTPLLSIFKAGLDVMPRTDRSVDDLAAEFLRMKQARVRARALKWNSYGQQKDAVTALTRKFGGRMMSEVRNPEFERWIMSLPHSPSGRYSFSKALGVFLNWAVEKKHALHRSPLKELDIPQPAPKRIAFTFAEARVVLAIAVVEFPELTSIMGAEWFAAVRPETAALLDYSDFIRSEGAIRVRVGKHEQGDVEFIEGFHPVLWKWIRRKKSGPIAPPNLGHRVTAFHRRLGFDRSRPWPQDVARRTALSHFISLTGSLEKGARVALHTRPSITLKHYRRRFPKHEAEDYYRMTPESLSKWYKNNKPRLKALISSIHQGLAS